MKCIVFGLSLIVVSSVCSAAPGDSPALNDDDAAQLVELPAPPDLLPQMPALLPLFREAVTRIIDTHALIRAAAQKHRVPAAFISSIVAAESNFDPNALSPKGAIGLMQLMPATAQLFGADPAVPEQNVDAGTHYLRVLMDKYHKYRNSLTRVIAAYNAGPGVVDRYHGVPPYRETKTYVARVLAFMKKYQRERA
jgi:soluble lytic murein transglycosylase-like protein